MFGLRLLIVFVMKDTNEEKTVQEELVEDMMALIARFKGNISIEDVKKVLEDVEDE